MRYNNDTFKLNHNNVCTKRPMLIFQISGNWNPERQTQLHRIREKTGVIKLCCLVAKSCPTLWQPHGL